MKTLAKYATVVALSAPLAFATAAVAENTLVVGMTGDAVSLDPHALARGTEYAYVRLAYESLTSFDDNQQLIPTLAESWENVDATTWRFNLRQGVSFHEGQDFTADDVVFSLGRAGAEGSQFASFVKGITEVEKVSDHEILIKTEAPSPMMLENLTSVPIMDAGWSAEHGVEGFPDKSEGQTYYSDGAMNGTGQYRMGERTAEVSSTFVANENWWGNGSFPGNYDTVVLKPVRTPATRVASFLSGELDMIQDVPLADVSRVAGQAGLRIEQAPEMRTVFLMFNESDQLPSGGVEGNPFKDARVRQAVNLAIDANLIKDRIMRGAAAPTSALVPPTLAGYSDELAARGDADPDKARALLAEAGYADGFPMQLDCPINRYVNDEAICQALTSMLTKVGLKVTMNAQPVDKWISIVMSKQTDLNLVGLSSPSNDSNYFAQLILVGGPFHLGYKNDRVNELSIAATQEIDSAKREAMMAEVFQIAKDEAAIAPVHYQMVTWGLKDGVTLPASPMNVPDFRYAVSN